MKTRTDLKTRSGQPVRILCDDAKGAYPVVGLIDRGADEIPCTWTQRGEMLAGVRDNDDLILEGG